MVFDMTFSAQALLPSTLELPTTDNKRRREREPSVGVPHGLPVPPKSRRICGKSHLGRILSPLIPIMRKPSRLELRLVEPGQNSATTSLR
jgi:hypothetical protein